MTVFYTLCATYSTHEPRQGGAGARFVAPFRSAGRSRHGGPRRCRRQGEERHGTTGDAPRPDFGIRQTLAIGPELTNKETGVVGRKRKGTPWSRASLESVNQ